MTTLIETPVKQVVLKTRPKHRATSFVVPATPKGSRNYRDYLKAMQQIGEACKDNTIYSF